MPRMSTLLIKFPDPSYRENKTRRKAACPIAVISEFHPNPSIRGVGAPIGRVERLAMDGPVVSRYLTLSFNHPIVTRVTSMLDFGVLEALTGEILLSTR